MYVSTACFPLKKRPPPPVELPSSRWWGRCVRGWMSTPTTRDVGIHAARWSGQADGWNRRCIENCRGLKVLWFLCHHCHLNKSWLRTTFICSTLYVQCISFTNPKYTLPYIAIYYVYKIFDKSVHAFQTETAVLTKTTRITFSMCYLFPHA